MRIDLVLVHLGGALPKHLVANLERLSKSNWPIRIHCIVEASAFIPLHLHESIEFSHFERANYSNLLENVSTLPRDFRHGFWIHTIERFIALANWHDKHPSEVLLHIESDILLMKSFPWTFFAGLESPHSGHDLMAFSFGDGSQGAVFIAQDLCQGTHGCEPNFRV